MDIKVCQISVRDLIEWLTTGWADGQAFYQVMYHSSGGLRVPPVKSVADFLRYLLQARKLQPSTIDGYRSAIADSLENLPINVSKDENLTRLLDSFH